MVTSNMDELKILCPFCNSAYTAEMLNKLEYSQGCETCGDGLKESEVKIYCSNCKKLVYSKYFSS